MSAVKSARAGCGRPRPVSLAVLAAMSSALMPRRASAQAVESLAFVEFTQIVVGGLVVLFAFGLVHAIVGLARAWVTLRRQIDRPKPSLAEVEAFARTKDRPLPFLVILVPAREETAVIANTIGRLMQLDYPREHHAVVVVCDERERAPGPTTRDIAGNLSVSVNAALAEPYFHVIEVPEWFGGRLGDKCRTHAKSTKGRALNYALTWVRDHPRLARAEMIGIVDADARMHAKVLCEVAYHRLDRDVALLQGPVFQISNFDVVSLVGKAAGIELSLYHLSTLSRRLMSRRRIARFLAGTNYFVDLRLMLEAGGWNEHALVEDAELGLRLFLGHGVRAEWLSCHEIEQTPPDRMAYLRQRERWTFGHFQLLPQIRSSGLPWSTKAYLQGLVVGAAFKTVFDLGLPLLGWIALVAGWSAAMPRPFGWVMLGLLVGSVFAWDGFGQGASLLNRYAPKPLSAWSLLRLRLLFVVAMPWLMIVQAWPRFSGLARWFFGRDVGQWMKTPRTVEAPIAQSSLPPERGDPALSAPGLGAGFSGPAASDRTASSSHLQR